MHAVSAFASKEDRHNGILSISVCLYICLSISEQHYHLVLLCANALTVNYLLHWEQGRSWYLKYCHNV